MAEAARADRGKGTARATVAATGARAKAFGASNLLTTGAIAGLVAGFVFILANMIYVVSNGMPAIAPFAAIGTVFFFDDRPMMTPEYVITGVITHFALSILFGIIFALFVPMFANAKALTLAALVYGLLLYAVNFLVLGSLIFEWFSPAKPTGPPQVLELILHPLAFGLVLVPFFSGMVYRHGSPEAARAAAAR